VAEQVPLSLAEAADWLDPPVAARTLRSLVKVAHLEPIAHRTRPGPPIPLYAAVDLMKVHAAWVEGHLSATRVRRTPADLALDTKPCQPDAQEESVPSRYNDRLIHAALASGLVTADPDTGIVYNRAGRALGGRNNGYLRVNLPDPAEPGRRRYVQAHRIVWIAANGPIPPGLEPNHKDLNRSNNRLSNLELVTHRENIAHGKSLPEFYRGELPMDLETVDPQWLADIRARAAAGELKYEEARQLLPHKPEPPEEICAIDAKRRRTRQLGL
jgi:hypothetical protein